MKIYTYKGASNVCGSNIRLFRRKAGLSQGELAARMQIEGVLLEQKSISRIECGERFVTDYEIIIFSKVLGVSITELLPKI